MIHDFSQDNWLFYVLKGHVDKRTFLDIFKKYNRSHYDFFVVDGELIDSELV